MDFLKFQYCHLCNQIKTGPNAWHLEPTPNLEKHSDKHQSLAEACSIMLHQQAEACICVYMSSHHFATNLCKRLPYTAAAFPWWSSGPPYSAAWGQREPWVQLAALAATWCSAPRSGGPNPRKLCQDGVRIEGTGSSAVGSGWHVGWDETRQQRQKQTSLWMESNIVIWCNLYVNVFEFICHIKLVQSFVHQ